MSIADKYTAFAKAMQKLQSTNPALWSKLDADQKAWTGEYSISMINDVAAVRKAGLTSIAHDIDDFWSDPGAWEYEKKVATAAANGVKGALGGVANAAAAVGQTGQNVAGAVGSAFDISGLISAIVNKNTWLRIGEAAIGVILLGIGVSIVAKSTSAGQTATKVAKTAAKVVK